MNSLCWYFKQDAMAISLVHPKQTTYWNLASTGKVFAWAMLYVDKFGKHNCNFFGRFSNSSSKHFEQDAIMALSLNLVHPKE